MKTLIVLTVSILICFGVMAQGVKPRTLKHPEQPGVQDAFNYWMSHIIIGLGDDKKFYLYGHFKTLGTFKEFPDSWDNLEDAKIALTNRVIRQIDGAEERDAAIFQTNSIASIAGYRSLSMTNLYFSSSTITNRIYTPPFKPEYSNGTIANCVIDSDYKGSIQVGTNFYFLRDKTNYTITKELTK